MAARKMVMGSGQSFAAEPSPESDNATEFPPSADSIAARLVRVANASPGAFYLVAAIIEGVLSAVPSARIDERVH